MNELMEPMVSENAKYVAETRYAMKGEDGKPIEKVGDIYWRVAYNIAKGDIEFPITNNQETNNNQLPNSNNQTEERINEQAKIFYNLMAEQ